MSSPASSLSQAKRLLRERMKEKRSAAARALPDAAMRAAENFLAAVTLPKEATVSLYHPMRDELDTGPLAKALAERGIAVALPVVAEKHQPLVFRRYRPGDALIAGAYGELVPDAAASEMIPSVVVAPLLAFTRDGGRLGYGGGYYDRTLAGLRKKGEILVAGYAYGAQEVDALPLSPLDQPLDWIVTEREAIRC